MEILKRIASLKASEKELYLEKVKLFFFYIFLFPDFGESSFSDQRQIILEDLPFLPFSKQIPLKLNLLFLQVS